MRRPVYATLQWGYAGRGGGYCPSERHADLTRKAETDAVVIQFSTGEAPDPFM